MEMQENYQPVVLRKILLSKNATREEIEEELRKYNPESESQSMTNTVLTVLQRERNNMIRKDGNKFVINSSYELSSVEIHELVDACNKRIEEFEEKNNINKKALYVTNNFPEMLNEFQKIVEKKRKAYYAIGNWKPANLSTPDFPLLLYLQSKGKVDAIFTVSKILNFDEFDKIENKMSYRVTQKPGDVDPPTSAFLEIIQTSILENPFPIGELIQFNNGKKVDYFPQRVGYVVDIGIPKSIQTIPSNWIWSVTLENWAIVKEKNIWASKIGEKIREKIFPGDKVIFYVLGTGQFKGIFEFDGDWYDAPEPVWHDESDSVIYLSQVHLLPLAFGDVVVYDIASELSIFEKPEDKRLVNLVLKGAGGYPSNNGKPIPIDDYNKIYEKMERGVNYWKISPGTAGEDWENQKNNGLIGIHFFDFGDLSKLSEDELRQKIREGYGKELTPAKQANTFGQMRDFMKIKEGDTIVANSGKSKILGVGRVAGPYKYRPESKYPNTFPVDWHDVNESTISKQEGWMVTVIQLSQQEFDNLMQYRTKYFLLRYNPENSWGDVLGEKYHFGPTVQNHKKLAIGAKTIWFDTDASDYHFWGYGDVTSFEKKSDEHQYAIYDRFTFFNSPSNGTVVPKQGDQSIREKIRSVPNFNNRFSILPITKEVYEEIINGKPQKISGKEKTITSTHMIDDDFESLIRKFDTNRNLFYSEWISQKNESLKTREDFVTKFPIEGIKKISLDDYVIGKPDKITGDVRRGTFSYILEKSLNAFGGIAGRWSRFHGIYWRKETNGYVWNGDFENPEEAFSEIKNQISGMLNAAQILEQDRDWVKFSEYMKTQRKTLMANIKSKILSVYFPELFLNLHKKALLTDILDELEIQYNKKSYRYIKEKSLLDYKNNHPIMKNWDNIDYSHFLWFAILKKIDEDEIEPEEFEVDEVESVEAKSYTLPEKTFDNSPLIFPRNNIDSIKEEIKKELLIDDHIIDQIITSLYSGKNILLTGPVGTGKTHLAQLIPKLAWKEIGGYYPQTVTATSDWTTQDVIGGIFPKIKNNEITYLIQKGCVAETVSKNWENETSYSGKRVKKIIDGHEYNGVWLVIDEFNRANIDKAFGQLFTALEYKTLDIPTTDPKLFSEKLLIPEDYRMIGTLNTFDKHFLFRLSDALKRRFSFIEILPPSYSKRQEEMKIVAEKAILGLREVQVELKINSFDDIKKDSSLMAVLENLYEIMAYIRLTKNLGTALLISMFRFILINYLITKNWDKSLDQALLTNLLPQLESLQYWQIDSIMNFIWGRIHELFRKFDIRNRPDIDRYEEELKTLTRYLKLSGKNKNAPNWNSKFRTGEITRETDPISDLNPWNGISRPNLQNFRSALAELKQEKGYFETEEISEDIQD